MGLLLALIGAAKPVGAASLLSDNFDTCAVGSLPSLWQVYAGVGVVTNHVAASSPNSAYFGRSANALVEFGYHGRLWFQADVHVISSVAPALSYLKFIDGSSGFAPFQILLNQLTNGTYDVKLLNGRSLTTETTYTNLVEAGSAFHTITFGVSVTNAVTGDGLFSLYVGTNVVALNVPFVAYSSPALQMNRFQLVNHGSQAIHLDNVGIFDSDPHRP